MYVREIVCVRSYGCYVCYLGADEMFAHSQGSLKDHCPYAISVRAFYFMFYTV